ncbi:3-deoxy-D-manno-octulosonic acid transferase [Pacificispira sp.]|uniref:3-deoxy-D-manno-octulosonic acid transferase n=1 Tax=Pacificispira sp. TaxID=2888761 RepID=UPI003B5296A4
MIARGLYLAATALAAPLIDRYLDKRLARGKEDAERFGERRGRPGRPRPEGPLVWIHAASNGEAMSSLPLVQRILDRDPKGHVLVTTGTVTSAKLMAARLPARAIHQYVPVDRTAWVRSFLKHWRPDTGIWVESEFWPALIWEMRRAGKPMALVNGRVSLKSLARWRRIPGIAVDLLDGFDPCLAQTPKDAAHLRDLGAAKADCVGNLKLSVPPQPVDGAVLETERARLRGRPVWVAASTHPGEEAVVAEAHRDLAVAKPDILTILVPRHPHRGEEIAGMLRDKGLTVALRSRGDALTPTVSVYVADTLGELGLFYRLAPVAMIGGSLCGGHGGHNPIEPAQLGCIPLCGPDMTNFATVAADLLDRGGMAQVADAADLARAVRRLLEDSKRRSTMAKAAGQVTAEGAATADRVMARLAPILPPVTPGAGR